MSDHITKCGKCGSTAFFVHESSTRRGRIDAYGLTCTSAATQIDEITCERCGAEYVEADFARIDFN